MIFYFLHKCVITEALPAIAGRALASVGLSWRQMGLALSDGGSFWQLFREASPIAATTKTWSHKSNKDTDKKLAKIWQYS